MFRSKAQYEPEAAWLSPADLEHGIDSSNRLNSPSVVKSVLQPLEQKIYQYDVLMQQTHQQTVQLDEEIRLMQEQRSRAEERFILAQGKLDEYEQHHQDVSRALRGEYNPHPQPERVKHVVRIENIDKQTPQYDRQAPLYDKETPLYQNEKQAPLDLGRLDPSGSFTHHQIFYIFIMAGLGGMIISGGVNFGLAYGKCTLSATPHTLFDWSTKLTPRCWNQK
ncbi:hypothetical protein G7Z17_g2010 [Cylindrodendrum hubeiense]|uniref:Uncharacterized protein n=1 Tax=Cylindrodendrum hubeiense TaxID=595255 RepID=A0A9P5HEZ1_9HYPO|nr:hypothetical protein G7Z17_g2010 [Cylindrodendrum hubeiense]